MKLTLNQVTIPIGTGLCGVLAGIVISGGLGSNPAKALLLSGLIATPPSFLAYLVVDGKANERVRKAQRLASDKTLELDKTKTLLTNTQKSNSQLAGELEKLRRQLAVIEGETSTVVSIDYELRKPKGRCRDSKSRGFGRKKK